MIQCYKHTGAAPASGVLGGLILGVAAAIVGAVVYSYALVYIPIVHVSFLLTLCFGALIGAGVHAGVRHGKVRNPPLVAALGLVCGLIGYYYAWAFDWTARAGQSFTMDPQILWSYVVAFNEQGAWSMHDYTPKGIALALVWLVEAGLIVGIATHWAYSRIDAAAFCEQCNCWATPREAVRWLPLERLEEVEGMLERGRFAPLAEMADINQPVFLRLDLSRCESCQEAFLTLTTVRQTINKKGEVSTEVKDLVRHALIDPSQLCYLQPRAAPAETAPASKTAAPEEEQRAGS